MLYILFIALSVGAGVSAVALLSADLAVGWVFFVFTFVVAFSTFLVIPFLPRGPQILAASSLLVSLIVLGEGLFGTSHAGKGWITITAGGGMAALSAFTLYWTLFKFKPGPEPALASDEAAWDGEATEALKCPSCGSPDVEGDYPEYKCPYCGTRFVAVEAAAE